jgi:starvation-inducible DNA-binding protein
MSNRTAHLHAVNSTQLRSTHSDLEIETRHTSIEALNGIVVHAIDIALAAKHAHWNVRGSNFLSYHKLFDKVFVDLVAEIDALGERATAIGGIARGTVQTVADSTQLKPYPVLTVCEREHIEELAMRLGRLGSEIRRAIFAVAKTQDAVTVDVLTAACSTVDSLLWTIESHIERA